MESLIVHPKNQMELNALKSVMKDMGIKFEKFHTRNHNAASKPEPRPSTNRAEKPARNFKDKPKNDQ
ncbi:DUF2683 family protein [Kaistella sp.]|uniref:DUF2683 family protein n=1 Tax=Kaistella sp. TaxID=2782235 RepID=UPI00359F6275